MHCRGNLISTRPDHELKPTTNSPEAGLDIRALLKQHEGRNYDLHAAHVNPANVRTLKTIGFDRCYVRATGPYLWDVQGTKYLDMLAGYGVFGLGRTPRGPPCAQRFPRTGLPEPGQAGSAAALRVARRRIEEAHADSPRHGVLRNSGAEGIETALKYARCATRRPAILYCEKAFHGLTYGALSINGDESFRSVRSISSDCRKIPFNNLEALERELHRGDVAAFVVEPIQGKGVNIPSPGYLREEPGSCHQHGALFVDDEVQTGMGRTGRFLAIEHDGEVDADIVVLAKTLSGGFVPAGAVLCKQWIHEKAFPA